MRRVFVRFLEEIEDSKEAFRNYLTLSTEEDEWKLIQTKKSLFFMFYQILKGV